MVMLHNFREENYQSTGNLSVNIQRTPKLSIYQTKLIEVSNILELLNNTIVPAVLNLQDSKLRPAVQTYP